MATIALAGVVGGVCAHPRAALAEGDEDALAIYRGRFKRGMDRYKAGALSEAIGYWEPIYRELGEQKGYRLAYDIGVAYQELGDATRAAERFQAFLGEVDTKRERGEALAPLVEKEEADARSRIAGLVATKGRIHVEALGAPRTARVDAGEPRLASFVAWVVPGQHSVTFGEGTPDAETKTLRVEAGEIVVVSPTPVASADTAASAPPPPESQVRRETHHPFPWQTIAVSGGATILAGIAAVPLYLNTSAMHDRLSASGKAIAGSDRENFASARTLAYSVLGAAVGFGAVTAGLAAWYFVGTSEREVMIRPALGFDPRSATIGLTGRF